MSLVNVGQQQQGWMGWTGVKIGQAVKFTANLSLFYLSELPNVAKGLLAQCKALPEYVAIICPPTAAVATEAGFAYVLSPEDERRSITKLHPFPLPKKMTYVLLTNGTKIALINFAWNYLTLFAAHGEGAVAKFVAVTPGWLRAVPFIVLLTKENFDFGLRTALMSKSHSLSIHQARKKKTDSGQVCEVTTDDDSLNDIAAGETKSLLSYFVQLILLNIADCIPVIRYPAMIVWALLIAQQMIEYRLGDDGMPEHRRKTFFMRNVGFVGSFSLPPIMMALLVMTLLSCTGFDLWSLGVFPLLVDLIAIPMTGLAEVVSLSAADTSMKKTADRGVLDHLRTGTHIVFDELQPYATNIVTETVTLYRRLNNITEPTIVRMIVKTLGLVHRILDCGVIFPQVLCSQAALAQDPVVRELVLEYLQSLDNIIGDIQQKQGSAVGFLLLKFPRVGCGLLYLLYNLPGSLSGAALRSLNNSEETQALRELRGELQKLILAIKVELAKPVITVSWKTRLTGGVTMEIKQILEEEDALPQCG